MQVIILKFCITGKDKANLFNFIVIDIQGCEESAVFVFAVALIKNY
jgi:hypothetical protein